MSAERLTIEVCSYCGEQAGASAHGHGTPDFPAWHWERVEYVPAADSQGAVSTLSEVQHILRAIDAQYVAMKYLPTTEPRARVLQALALIEGGQ